MNISLINDFSKIFYYQSLVTEDCIEDNIPVLSEELSFAKKIFGSTLQFFDIKENLKNFFSSKSVSSYKLTYLCMNSLELFISKLAIPIFINCCNKDTTPQAYNYLLMTKLIIDIASNHFRKVNRLKKISSNFHKFHEILHSNSKHKLKDESILLMKTVPKIISTAWFLISFNEQLPKEYLSNFSEFKKIVAISKVFDHFVKYAKALNIL